MTDWCFRRHGAAGQCLELFVWECLAGDVVEEVDEGGAAAAHQRGGARSDHQGSGEDDHLQEQGREWATPGGAGLWHSLSPGAGGQLSHPSLQLLVNQSAHHSDISDSSPSEWTQLKWFQPPVLRLNEEHTQVRVDSQHFLWKKWLIVVNNFYQLQSSDTLY